MAVNGNVPTMQSLWEPTPQELDWLARGGKVRLGVGGTEHPLVFLMVDLPPDDQP